EIEKKTHVPLPYWYLECTLKKANCTFQAKYKQSPIHTLSLAETIFREISDSQYATVRSIQKFRTNIPPRYPFDLGDLQREAFYNYGMTPRSTLAIAEKLYLMALISYPRTESQKLPRSIHPQEILRRLAKNLNYKNMIEMLFSERSLRRFPWQGPRDDPAHPAIYPTGQLPKKALSVDEKKIYDLITRRFCNTFAPDAIVEKTQASFDISAHEFSAEWEKVIEEGWMKYYPFRKLSSASLSVELETGEKVSIDAKSKTEKYSPAPSRYNEGSLLSKMESEGIGTKATRADTISTLIDRKYIRKSRDLVPEENALLLINQLRKHCPEIVSTAMTRSLEKKLELMQKGQENEESVMVEELNNIRAGLRSLVEMDELDWQTNLPTVRTKNLQLGDCPKCKTGSLQAIRSPRTRKRFIRCTNYQNGCKTSSPLPSHGMIKTTSNHCNICGWPMVIFLRSRTAASQTCSNYFCSTRKQIERS
ncbi:MAG: DNA topoisomerase, partial [Nitrososphaerales archaeon]